MRSMNNSSVILPRAKEYGCIILAAVLWGFMGLFNKHLIAAGVSALTVAMLRNTGSMMVLSLTFIVVRPSVFKINLRHIKYFLGTGIFSVLLFTVCFFCSQKYCTLAVASSLEYTAPIFVVVISSILWKEPITKQKVFSLLLVVGGCALSAGIFTSTNVATTKGLLLALASGFFYALYSIFSRYALTAGCKPFTIIIWTFIFAGLGSLVFFDRNQMQLIISNPNLIFWAFGLIIFATVLPYLFYTIGLRSVESGQASILSTLELPTASLIGVLIFGEQLTKVTFFGIVLIFTGIILLNFRSKKR